MKTLKVLAATIALSSLTLAGSAMADTKKIQATDNSVSTEICVAAAKDRVVSFNKAVSDSRLSMKKVAHDLSCNGLDIAALHKSKAQIK